MIKPSRKDSGITTHSFLLLVMLVPTRSPIGVIAISAPRVKNIIPRMMSTPPIRKHSRMLGDIGAMLKHSTRTIPMIGSTALSASFSFSISFLLFFNLSPQLPVS